MNEQVAQEEPWDFEHKPENEPQPVEAQKPVWREYTFSITRNLFRMDGMAHRVLEVLGLVGLKAKSLAERGPQDFASENDFERGIRLGRSMAPPQYKNGDDESNWKTIALFVMGFLQALILAFMGYIYSTTSQTHDDVIRIKCRLDPQSCMGSPANVVNARS